MIRKRPTLWIWPVSMVRRPPLTRLAKIVHPPEEGQWAPGYYSVLFEDPDGIRLELNFVPGKGLLADEARFNPVGYDV